MIHDTRTLAKQVIEHDLLGPEALLAADDIDVPSSFKGYEITREIGRGGAGVVYLARDRTLDRPLAIKFLLDAGPCDLERFRREARYAARLTDVSIVQVYELGEVDDRPYIAMQYLEGGNLGSAPLDHAGVVRALRSVAVALSRAHAEGIVHRDIKPENILLDRAGRAYVADFGIARDLNRGRELTLSGDGQIIGTPGLMPPEQARGDIRSIDARSDVYALGATLYVKLTGRRPFDGPHLVEILHAVIHDEPVLPRALDASIPYEIETIIMKCLQKCREDRYQTMDEVVAAFDRFLAGTSGGQPSAWLHRLVNQREEAPTPLTADDLQSDPFWTVGVDVVREIAAWDADLYRVSGSLAPSFARLDALRERLDAILDERPDLAWARFYRGVALFRRGRLGAALEEMERAIDRVGDQAGASFELGRLYLALYLREHHDAHKHITRRGIETDLSSARGRLEQAAIAFGEVERLRGELSPWHRGYARAVTHLAEQDFDACIAACDRILERDPDVEEVWKLRGDALRFAGTDPIESYERAIAVRRSYFEALHAKAEAHIARGEVDEARTALARAREIHPEFAGALVLLARICLVEARRTASAGPLDEGLRLAEQGLALDESSYDAAVTLAEIHLELGRGAGGDAALASALAALERAGGLAGCQNRVNLITARTYLERGRRATAGGRDPRPARDAVLELCRGEPATRPDADAWREVRAAAGQALIGPE